MTEEVCLSVNDKGKQGAMKYIWVADSGSSTHMGFEEEGMFDVRNVNSPVKVGSGKYLKAAKM